MSQAPSSQAAFSQSATQSQQSEVYTDAELQEVDSEDGTIASLAASMALADLDQVKCGFVVVLSNFIIRTIVRVP